MASTIQVSWVQFQAPDHIGGVPINPVDPVCITNPNECGCDCGACFSKNRNPLLSPLTDPSGYRQGQFPFDLRSIPIPRGPQIDGPGKYRIIDLPKTVSKHPIRYGTGEVIITATDLQSKGGSFRWGHSRSVATRLTEDTNPGNGYNWQVAEWPYLVFPSDTTVVVMGNANEVLWFDLVGNAYGSRQ